MKQIVESISILFAVLSAVFWVKASLINSPVPTGYLSGPPQNVVHKISKQSKLNSLAAFCAAIASITQLVSRYLN